MTRSLERLFAWIGGALFVTSLALTGWMYVLWFAESRPRTSGWAILGDVVLVSAFALHHSLFARPWMKAALAAFCPERLLRSLYVWVASLLLIVVCLLWRRVGGEVYRAASGWAVGLHAVVQITGVWLIAGSVRAIDALELAGIRTARAGGAGQDGEPGQARQTWQARQARQAGQAGQAGRALEEQAPHIDRATEGAEALQVDGPYRLVRHPLYLGWMLIVFGASHLTGDRLTFAAITSIYLVVAIPWEERSLEAAFGDAYARYKARVRWRVVPYLY